MSLVFTSCGYPLHSGMVIWTRVCVVVPPHDSGFHVLWVCFTLWYGNMDQVWVVVPPHESGFHVLWVCFTLWYSNMDQGLGG